MDGYALWRLHRAVKLHLTTLNYDIVQSRGQTKNTSLEKYISCREKYVFENLSRHIKTPGEGIHFFISNIVYTGTDEMFDSTVSWDNYSRWIKEKESLSYIVRSDLDGFSADKLQGNPPKILNEFLQKKVHIQTIVVLNRIYDFVDEWIEQDYFTFNKWCVIIKKLDNYVKCDVDKIKNFLQDHETV